MKKSISILLIVITALVFGTGGYFVNNIISDGTNEKTESSSSDDDNFWVGGEGVSTVFGTVNSNDGKTIELTVTKSRDKNEIGQTFNLLVAYREGQEPKETQLHKSDLKKGDNIQVNYFDPIEIDGVSYLYDTDVQYAD